MAKFKVNEVVVFIESEAEHAHLVGEECEILSLLDNSYSTYKTNQFYKISLKGNDGSWIGCAEDCLRKKKPPEQEINWVEKLELKNWNPTKEVAL